MRDHTAMPEIDLNVDAGESFGAWPMGDDAALFAEVSSANLACGFHAGDPGTIRAQPRRGAGSGRRDRRASRSAGPAGFGRRAITLTPQEVSDDTLYQVGAMAAFVRAAGTTLHHVKPHGALNTAVAESSDEHADGDRQRRPRVRRRPPDHRDRGLAPAPRAAQRAGHPVVAEGFPDRAYAPDGSLARRGTPGALIHDPEMAAARAVRMALVGSVRRSTAP